MAEDRVSGNDEKPTRDNSGPRNGNRCQWVKSNGQQCEANALATSSYCFFHDPDTAKEREAARRAGGIERSRRVALLPPDTPDWPLQNKRELAGFYREMCNRVVREEIDARIAYIASHLATLSLKALEGAESEERWLRYQTDSAREEAERKGKREAQAAAVPKKSPRVIAGLIDELLPIERAEQAQGRNPKDPVAGATPSEGQEEEHENQVPTPKD